MTLDYDGGGRVVGLELIDVSQQMHDPRTIQFLELSSHLPETVEGAVLGRRCGPFGPEFALRRRNG